LKETSASNVIATGQDCACVVVVQLCYTSSIAACFVATEEMTSSSPAK
jgi:hypothetical protein